MLPGLQKLACVPANTPDTKGITNINGGNKWMIDPPIELPIAYYDDYENDQSEERIAVQVDMATVNSHEYRGSNNVNYNVIFRDSRDPDSFHVWLLFVHDGDEVFPEYFTLNFGMNGVAKQMNSYSTMYGICQERLLPVMKEIIAAGA